MPALALTPTTIKSIRELLQLCQEHRLTRLKFKDLEIEFGAPGNLPSVSEAAQASEPIELTDDVPTDDELLFAASGFQVISE